MVLVSVRFKKFMIYGFLVIILMFFLEMIEKIGLDVKERFYFVIFW